MKTDYEKAITEKLKRCEKKHIKFKVLLSEMKSSVKKFDFQSFNEAVERLKVGGRIFEDSKGLCLAERVKLIKCEVVKVGKTFGFVRNCETGEDYFVAGRSLMGAMPTDIVAVREVRGRGDSPEAEVVSINEENFRRFSGNIVSEFGELRVMPDSLSKYAMDLVNPEGIELYEGDKVLAEIVKRGERHSEHICKIISDYGSSLRAAVCAMSVLDVNGITPMFPAETIAQARKVSDERCIKDELPRRLDLRGEPIFTIDGADTKDIDDAVSVRKTNCGYELGVHIADVSHYVTPKSPLDEEALRRGTSVYYANRVIPMLPKELSNGICSLNPKEDRLALSCLMKLDESGEVKSFRFAKTVIRSRVKGVYSEINELLEGFGSKALYEKYAEVTDCLPIIAELAKILRERKRKRGTPEIASVESKLIISGEDVCIGVKPKERGESEEIIEDFMLLANECAAKLGRKNKLPFVYRIHEPPSAEKLDSFKMMLTLLNIPFPANKTSWEPSDFAGLLESAKGTPQELMINTMALRTMSKARYSTEPAGHYGLVLADYAHFTSPIRRYPDLAIHRIISDFIGGISTAECHRKYDEFVLEAAQQSTDAEIRAMSVERDCEDRYKAEYMKGLVGESFDGVVSSVTGFGIFVSLPSTCEGLVRLEALGEGEYYFDGAASLKNMNSGKKYMVGDCIRITVENANVSSGKVDFVLAESMEQQGETI